MRESVLGKVWFHMAIPIASIIPCSCYMHFDSERNPRAQPGMAVPQVRIGGLGEPGPYIGEKNAIRDHGRGMESVGDIMRSGSGRLVSRMGRSTSPGRAGG